MRRSRRMRPIVAVGEGWRPQRLLRHGKGCCRRGFHYRSTVVSSLVVWRNGEDDCARAESLDDAETQDATGYRARTAASAGACAPGEPGDRSAGCRGSGDLE